LFIKETRVASLYGISQLMDKALAHPVHFPLPTLVLYGLNDRIIPPAPTCAWLSRLSLHADKVPAHVQFVVYPEGWHMLTRQTRAAEVTNDLRDWLTNVNHNQQGGHAAASRSASHSKDMSPSLEPAQQAVCQRAGRFP
jgi:alpha-beta hydrolase superfamily lysophospholipase